MDKVTQFLARLDKWGFRRSAVMVTVMWMTWEVTQWAMWFALFSPKPGLEVAAIIGAVTGPVTLLAGSVFKNYVERKPL